MSLTKREIEAGDVVEKIDDLAYEIRSSYLDSGGRMPTRKIKKLREYLDKVLPKHCMMAVKDAEIEQLKVEDAKLRVLLGGADVVDRDLRALIGEMADALLAMNDWGCLVCASRHNSDCENGNFCDRKVGNNALVARAREAVKE